LVADGAASEAEGAGATAGTGVDAAEATGGDAVRLGLIAAVLDRRELGMDIGCGVLRALLRNLAQTRIIAVPLSCLPQSV
jgi:hypothetical protein